LTPAVEGAAEARAAEEVAPGEVELTASVDEVTAQAAPVESPEDALEASQPEEEEPSK
jgi:hypothetical protein